MREASRAVGRAWLLLTVAIALHVVDEALTGFLNVYNPTVAAIRAAVPWLPLPVFRFDAWLGGFFTGIAAMGLVTPFVFAGLRWTRTVAYVLAVFMVLNACGHVAGTILGHTAPSVQFERPMPGFYSSPFLLAAAIYLLSRLTAYPCNDVTKAGN